MHVKHLIIRKATTILENMKMLMKIFQLEVGKEYRKGTISVECVSNDLDKFERL